MCAVLSCGPVPKRHNPDASTEPEKIEPPVKAVRARSPVTTVHSADRKSSFIVRVKSSDIEFGSTGPDYGELKDVTGEINRGGKLTSRFASPAASVDATAHSLTMTGGVTVTGEGQGLVLKAKTVHYDQDKGRIEAKGSVTVTSDAMVLGPVPELWATPDLKRIATPGKFK